MERGTDIFGEAYGIMLQNDLHADGSVDRRLMQEMILIDESSADYLYGCVPEAKNMKSHELYEFAQSFLGRPQKETVKNIVKYCSDIAKNYSVPFENMSFGGTEKEILERGTDWCADMARVGAALLMCCGIPSRLVYLVNPDRAYSGHVAAEAFYEGKYGVCDFIYGIVFTAKPRQIHTSCCAASHILRVILKITQSFTALLPCVNTTHWPITAMRFHSPTNTISS